jgi:hypothetical protein
MEEQLPYRNLSRGEERRLIQRAADAVMSDFPNPERLGCPKPKALIAIAQGRLSSPESHDIIDHIATCSPCFLEYRQHRRRHRMRVIAKMALASAAGLMLIAVLWHFGPEYMGRRQPPITKEIVSTPLSATLDFRNRTIQRSESAEPYNQDVPHLTRVLVNLAIKLPVGVEDGLYQVELRTRSNKTVLSSAGTASWHEGAETLTTTLDCRRVTPGEYTFAIRKGTSAWRLYPVIFD